MLKVLWFTLIFFVAAVIAVVATFPMKAALKWAEPSRHGLSYGGAYGTIWNGGVSNAAYLGQTLGRVDVAITPASFLRGKIAAKVSVAGEVAVARGDVLAAFENIQLENVIADINVQKLIYLDPRLRHTPSKLKVSIKRSDLTYDGRCNSMQSSLETDVLAAVGRQWQWTGPRMVGEVLCMDGRPQIRMNNFDGVDEITAGVDVQSDGGVLTRAHVRTKNEKLVRALNVLGFEYMNGVHQYENIAHKTAMSASAQQSVK